MNWIPKISLAFKISILSYSVVSMRYGNTKRFGHRQIIETAPLTALRPVKPEIR
jgi:hypothetical protein